MRRVILIATASLGLAGCSSLSAYYPDSLKPTPQPVTVQLDSVPQGADARTSLGPSCKTPCSVPVTADGSFSVNYTLNKYQPLTVPVQVTKVAGDLFTAGSTTIDPNPVVGELQLMAPPKHMVRKMAKKRRTAPAASTAPAAAPADAAAPAPPTPPR